MEETRGGLSARSRTVPSRVIFVQDKTWFAHLFTLDYEHCVVTLMDKRQSIWMP